MLINVRSGILFERGPFFGQEIMVCGKWGKGAEYNHPSHPSVHCSMPLNQGCKVTICFKFLGPPLSFQETWNCALKKPSSLHSLFNYSNRKRNEIINPNPSSNSLSNPFPVSLGAWTVLLELWETTLPLKRYEQLKGPLVQKVRVWWWNVPEVSQSKRSHTAHSQCYPANAKMWQTPRESDGAAVHCVFLAAML